MTIRGGAGWLGLAMALLSIGGSAAQEPASLRVFLNQPAYQVGDTLQLTASMTAGPPNVVDAYVVVERPDGSYLSLQLDGRLVPGLVPIATRFTPFAYTGVLFSAVVTPGVPHGAYRWLAALVQPGTLSPVGGLADVPILLGSGPGVIPFHGLNFSPWTDGRNPDLGARVTEPELVAHMSVVARWTQRVRIFGSGGGLQLAPRVAKSFGLGTVCSAWLGEEDDGGTANDAEIAALVSVARQGWCDRVVVGSEVLRRDDLSAGDLAARVRSVKAMLPDLPVATADTWDHLLANPQVLDAGDFVFANLYPFWQGIPIEYAVAEVHHRYGQLVAAARGKPVLVSETGWPSCGGPWRDALASPANARAYASNVLSWARAEGVDLFYFEAFDEPYKVIAEGPWGECWGVWDRLGASKPGMSDVLTGVTVPDNWSGRAVVGGPGTPSITFSAVPPTGDVNLLLRGEVRHVAPVAYHVAVYIKVGNLWWIKPSSAEPSTRVWPDGAWWADITTGGQDELAGEIAAFLLPVAVTPPIVLGSDQLPPVLASQAVASARVSRTP